MAGPQAPPPASERLSGGGIDDNFQKLCEHLEDVANNPLVSLDESMIDIACHEAFQVKLGNGERMNLLSRISYLLPTLQQDPSSVCDLVRAVITPESVSFSQILDVEPKVDFVTGLRSPSTSINQVTLNLLAKASQSSSDVEIVAGKREVMEALVQTWLCHEDLLVHQTAASLLELFLIGPNSSELMWRRLLGDESIYAYLFESCSLSTLGEQLSKNEKTIAQGRLLALISKIDGPEIRTPQCKNIESRFGVDNLLDFAMLSMVDWKGDLLMHMALIQVFADWLRESASMSRNTSPPMLSNYKSSPALDYLIVKGLHTRTIGYLIEPNGQDLDSTQLYSQAATYLEAYLTFYTEHLFTAGQETLKSIIARVSTVLDNTSANQFINSPPTTEVNVLLQLPPVTLLLSDLSSSPFLKIRSSSSLGFHALGQLFEGLHPHSSSKAAARALYFLYMEQHPDLWTNVIQMAQNLAFKEAAVMAGRLVQSVINAQWEPMDSLISSTNLDQSLLQMTNEETLLQRCNVTSLPPTGYLTVLTSPALESILPWLLSPAQKGTDLGLGGKGDPEGAANSVAAVKYDALAALYEKLVKHTRGTGTNSDWQDIISQMRKRLNQGRWGGVTEIGGNIATSQR